MPKRTAALMGVLLIAVAVSFVWIGRSGVGTSETPSAQENTEDTPTPASTATLEIVALPPEYPTPHRFADGDEVLQYVHDLIDPLWGWEEFYVNRAKRSDIELMFYGPGAQFITPGPDETPTGLLPDTPRGRQAVWIVGVRSRTIVTRDQLLRAQFMQLREPSSTTYGGYEMYFIVSDIGKVIEASFLDAVDEAGGSEHCALWDLADIENLPPPE